MSKLKTQPNKASVKQFINSIEDPIKKADSQELIEIMKEITGAKPVMWGSSIVGFGSYHYRYASGREGDWFKTGFSPRKQALTLYIMGGFQDKSELANLGKHSTGKGCLYIKRLSDIDLVLLKKFLTNAVSRLP
jgi:nucleoid DNA-binding protein